MTTDQIRKAVKVTDYYMNHTGIYIKYQWNDLTDGRFESKSLNLTPEDSMRYLRTIGEVDDLELLEWVNFIAGYKISQWDALNIVIRHEFKRSTNDILK